MPGAFGPILTTGVALSAAVVVVANPVTAPHTDVQIPAAAVSAGSGQAVDMLNEDFIEAVGPSPAPSTNPLSVLKDLVSTLVADAADLGKSAVLHAFAAGASVVSRPELTAASHPYLPPAEWAAVPAPIAEDLQPVVQQALAEIMANADAVAAGVSAGAALGTDPGALLESLRKVVDDSGQPVLANAVSALAAFPHPEVGQAVRSAVQQYLSAVPAVPAVSDIAALPNRWATSGPLAKATGGPVADNDATASASRQPLVERVFSGKRLRKDDGVNSPAARTVSPKHSGPAGPHRQTLSDAAGAISRAVKAHADRTAN